jgi:hypothetical protein
MLDAMTSVREHCSRVGPGPAVATVKTKRLVSSTVSRVAYQEPLEPVTESALVW